MTSNFVDLTPITVLENAKTFVLVSLSLTIKIKERFLSPIIGIGYLVLGTRSAAKFEKFPSTTKYTITTFIGLVFG